MDAGSPLTPVTDFPQAEAIAAVQDDFPTPSADDDYDDLYGDVNLGFLPLPPPSPSATSPPKTPSPGLSVASPSPPPRRAPKPLPEPESDPTPQHQPPLLAPKPLTPPHQPPLPMPKPPTPRHQPPLLAPKPPAPPHQPPPQRALGGSTSSSPPTTALYIGDLPWWTTDAEVEAALAPHGALHGLHFFADKYNGKSRGFCCADFLHPAAAASAAAALHGRAFHGHHCVASLYCPPALHRPGADFDAPILAPPTNPTLGRGGNASNLTTARGNVRLLGDQPAMVPHPQPMAPRPRAFDVMMGGGGGYGWFPSMGQCNAGMSTHMMPSMVAPHVNRAFLAASRMEMGGTGMWHGQGMAGALWGGQQPWNFGVREMSWQQPSLQQQHRQTQQQYYGKTRGTGRERPGGRNGERDIGNVRGNPDRRQCNRGGGKLPREHNRGERDRLWEHVLEKERERERNCDERDRHGGEKRRHQEYNERDDWERQGRTRSRSQSRNSDDDDHPRRGR